MKDSSTKPVIVLGAGGHAKVVADVLVQSGFKLRGFIAPEYEPGVEFCGSKVLGDEQVVENVSPSEVILANGIGAMPNNDSRWLVAAKMRKLGFSFATIIHPSVVIAPDVVLAEGVQIMAGSILQPGVNVGLDCIVNTGVILDHDCVIEKESHLAPGVVCSGGVRVGSRTHLGTRSTVIQCISIGCSSIIAAGSVIYKDVPDGVIIKQPRQSNTEIREI
ncbi:MAG: acetyltransferase [Gammaproteobacteria bacterium]|nr:acetyltransferase [Gammaproteobacteria bacterium]